MTEKRINKIFALQIATSALFVVLSILVFAILPNLNLPNGDGLEGALDFAVVLIFFIIFYLPVMVVNFVYNIIYCIVLKKKTNLTPIALIVLSFIIKIATIGFSVFFIILYAEVFFKRSILLLLILLAIFVVVILLSIISMIFETKIRKNEMKSL